MTQALSLSRPEIGALLELTGDDPTSIPQGERVTGVALLMARGLATIRDNEVHLAAELVEGLNALAQPGGRLLLASGAAHSEHKATEFFITGSRAVVAHYSGDEAGPIDGIDIIPCVDAPAAVAAALTARSLTAQPQVSPDELESTSVFGAESDGPGSPVEAATQMNWKPRVGDERTITILLHEHGFTWVEDGEKARVAYVETQEDLAELVANLIGFGAK